MAEFYDSARVRGCTAGKGAIKEPAIRGVRLAKVRGRQRQARALLGSATTTEGTQRKEIAP